MNFITKFNRCLFNNCQGLLFVPFAHDKNCSRGETIGDIGTGEFKFSTENILSSAIVFHTTKACISESYAGYTGAEWDRSAVGNQNAEMSNAVLLSQFVAQKASSFKT